MPKAQLHSLTSLRFFAAAIIVNGHGEGLFGTRGILGVFPYHQAVSFFFVLSGFILAYNYPQVMTAKEVGLFYATRLARIWPAHIVTALIALLLTPRVQWLPPADGELILLHLFLLQAWVPSRDVLLGLNLVSWALSVEIFFYACFPVVMSHWQKKWHLLLAGSFLLAASMVVVSNLFHLPRLEMTPGVTLMGTIYMSPPARLFEFVMGIAMASVYRVLAPRICWTRIQATVVEVGTLTLLAIILVVCKAHMEKRLIGEAGQYYLLMQGAGVMFAGVILVFAIGQGWLSRIFSLPLFVALGEMSFALYLVHTIILRHFELHKAVIVTNQHLWYLLYWGVCLVMAYALFVGVEQPMRLVLVSLAKRTIRPELNSNFPSLPSILTPMLKGAVLFCGLFMVGYWLRMYAPIGN